MPETKRPAKKLTRPGWQQAANGILLFCFAGTLWSWVTFGSQVNPWKISFFLFCLVLLYGFEKLAYRGQEGTGRTIHSGSRYGLFFFWYMEILGCFFFTLIQPRESFIFSALGGVWIAFGLLIRIWGIHTLGRYFSTYLETWQDHVLVEDGPYRWIRHPAYAGSLLIGIGFPFLMNAWWALLFYLGFAWMIYLRIQEEELFLREVIPGYAAYCERTDRLLPRVW